MQAITLLLTLMAASAATAFPQFADVPAPAAAFAAPLPEPSNAIVSCQLFVYRESWADGSDSVTMGEITENCVYSTVDERLFHEKIVPTRCRQLRAFAQDNLLREQELKSARNNAVVVKIDDEDFTTGRISINGFVVKELKDCVASTEVKDNILISDKRCYFFC